MDKDITYVGLDAHQETIHGAVLLPGAAAPAEDSFANTSEGIRRFVRRVRRRAPGEVVCAYEAGPLGYGLMRELEALGVSCVVVAPALIPVNLVGGIASPPSLLCRQQELPPCGTAALDFASARPPPQPRAAP